LGSNTVTQDEWVFDNSFPQAEGKPNPHLWVSTESAESYARLAAEQLSQLDPEGADYYAANLEAYLAKLEDLNQVTREVVDSIPPENRKLLTYHDSWPYWARQYGFEVIGAIQPSDFNEPSAQEISQLIDQIRQEKVPAIFGSEVFPSKVSEQIAREANVKLANTSDDDLPGDGSAVAVENSDSKHTYIGMMADNLRILAENLGGDPSLVDKLDTSNVVGPTAKS
jgi:ABC-type Zn uptake system ZnuABC Zn-binding protein ZnuA